LDDTPLASARGAGLLADAGAMTEPAPEARKPAPFGAERDPTRVVAFSDAVIAIAVTSTTSAMPIGWCYS
jgi:hypothetical protein